MASPRMLLLLWLVNVCAALPAAWALTSSIHDSVGNSLVADRLRAGFHVGWHGEFQDRARGIEKAFTADVAGAGAFYANLETWITGDILRLPPEILGLGVVYLLVWILLQGGIVSRLVRPRAGFRASRMLGNGARYFFRFLRLGILSGVAYFLVFRASWWAYRGLGEATRDVPEELPVLLLSLGLFGLTALLLAAVQASFSYAKIATVIEDRRSMLLAAAHGLQVLLGRPLRTMGLYAMVALALVAGLALYAWIAPVSGPATVTGVALAFALGQAYLIFKLTLRLSLLGGMVVLHPQGGSRSHLMSPLA